MTRDRARVSLRIQGLVQGVFFRADTRDEARRLGLTGWVANEPDGSVSVVAEGPRDRLEKLVTRCHEGPPAARVDHVDARWSDATGAFHEFTVRH